MDNLILALTNNAGAWEAILNAFYSFIGNVGWVVIILTILIKLVLTPFEFLQKKSMKKMTSSTALIQPELDKLKQKCGNNQELYNQKVQELYKKNNINPASGCGSMLLYMVLSSLIFITFFNCLRGVSTEQIVKEYNSLQTVYTTAYNYYMDEDTVVYNGVEYKILDSQKQEKIIDSNEYRDLIIAYNQVKNTENEITGYNSAEEYAYKMRVITLSQQAVVDGLDINKKDDSLQYTHLEGFTDIKQSFLWIKNIWRPDNYSKVFPSASEYLSSGGKSFGKKAYVIEASTKDNYVDENTNPLYTEDNGVYKVEGYYQTLDGVVIIESAKEGKEAFIADYNTVTKQINNVYNGWNGYLILVVLVALTTLFSGYLSNIGSKTKNKNGIEVKAKPKNNLIMSLVLTALFVGITWSYTAAFALYIVTSSLIGIPFSIATNYIINTLEEKERQKAQVSYSRYKKGD